MSSVLICLVGDQICIFLGCRTPIFLRQTRHDPDQFCVGGACFVHGIMFGEILLGPLRRPFRMQFVNGDDGDLIPLYLNTTTGEQSSSDPRLLSITNPWEEVPIIERAHNSAGIVHCGNRLVGEDLESDPRYLPEALDERGMSVRSFTLV